MKMKMKMKIQILSDIHNEFGILDVPVISDEKDTILVLAGDVGVATKKHTYVPFVKEMSERFKHVIYVLGNHEHWHGKFSHTQVKLWNELVEFGNVDVLEKESIIIDDVAFIGATLWTDMSKYDPLCLYQSKLFMKDYSVIRHGPTTEPWRRKLEPEDTAIDHGKAAEYIFNEIVEQKKVGRKVVVVTHHSPCSLSLKEEFKTDDLSGAYYSELSNEILDLEENQPELWIHGHCHNSSDYMIGNTRVIVNPRGYFSVEENYNFDPTLRIEV